MWSGRLQRVLSFVLLFVTVGLSKAWTQTQNARGDGPQSQQESERIWPLVAKAPYAGEGSGPILYVYAYSTCPYTAAFYKDWHDHLKGVQVRWVFYPVDPGTVNASAELSLVRNPELVGSIINRQHSSPPANASQASVDAFRLNQESLTQLNNVFKSFNQQHVISPTFIWKDDSTVWVTRGYDLATFKTLALPLIQKGAVQ